MPYIIASIIAAVSAIVILSTRYEADDSAITSQIEKMKTMVTMVDGFVNTYIESGGVLDEINFQVLSDAGILMNVGVEDYNTRLNPSDGTGTFNTSMRLPRDNVVWHIIPNPDNSSSYKLMVDMSGDSALMSKAIFSEGFIGREYCEKMLFGTLVRDSSGWDGVSDFPDDKGGTNDDGEFVCIVYK